jgi:hypothetical protein
VSVRDGTAYLRGEVATAERRQHVGDLVARLAPDLRVVNDVSVTDAMTMHDGPGEPEVIQ